MRFDVEVFREGVEFTVVARAQGVRDSRAAIVRKGEDLAALKTAVDAEAVAVAALSDLDADPTPAPARTRVETYQLNK